MNITIVNRHFAPTKAITGRSVIELVEFLVPFFDKIFIVSVAVDYKGGTDNFEGRLNHPDKVVSIKVKCGGLKGGKISRLINSQIENFRIFQQIRNATSGPIISLTDPPMLQHWVQWIARSTGRKWVYWSMDLYPQAFYSYLKITRLVSILEFLEKTIGRINPDAVIALGVRQEEFLKLRFTGNWRSVIINCGVIPSETNIKSLRPSWAVSDGDCLFGYVGNLGEAHDREMVLMIIESLNRLKKRVIVSVYGTHAQWLRDRIHGLRFVKMVTSVLPDELNFIDVHIVSLVDSWTHICVPSKAVSAICAGATCILVCNKSSDLFDLLGEASFALDLWETQQSIIDQKIQRITSSAIIGKKEIAKRVRNQILANKEKGFNEIKKLLHSWS